MSFLLIIALRPSPFFCISQSFHPGRLNSDPTFSLQPPLTRAGQPENLFSKPPAAGSLEQISQHKGTVLQRFLSGFLDLLKGILIIHFSYVYVLPLLDLRGTVH